MKYRLKAKNYSFSKAGMILEGEVTNDVLIVYAGDIVEENKGIMSKDDIFSCMIYGRSNDWCFPMEILEEIKAYKITSLEFEILKHINKNGIKYISRDSNNSLYVYKNKPYKDNRMWILPNNGYGLDLFKDCFQFINWEDEEPTLIRDILENCEVIEDE